MPAAKRTAAALLRHAYPARGGKLSASLLLALVCSEMKDGVVAFEDEADAEQYGELLEADGSAQVRWLCLFGSIVWDDPRAAAVLLSRRRSQCCCWPRCRSGCAAPLTFLTPPCSPQQVSVARCDSHELFRTVQDVRAVVVLLRRQEGPSPFLPQPHQLATSLRRSEEAGGSGA